MKFKTLFSIAIILLCFCSCKKENAPYVKFKNSSYKKIKAEIVEVDLNSDYTLIIENGYKSTPPVYTIQKNIEVEQNISNSNITQESQGWNGNKGLIFNVVRIHLDFDSNNFSPGDELKLYSRHSGISEFLTFRIK